MARSGLNQTATQTQGVVVCIMPKTEHGPVSFADPWRGLAFILLNGSVSLTRACRPWQRKIDVARPPSTYRTDRGVKEGYI